MNDLRLGEHISRQFNEDLEEVRSKVLQMGGLVEEQLVNAVRALVENDSDLAQQVMKTDARVNALEVEIDEECTRIVARRQPAATDLRLVMAVIKTIADLERIGDEVKRVAKMTRDELEGLLDEDIRNELEHMGELVKKMLHSVLDAFARTDTHKAVEVARSDRRVDVKYQSISRQLMTYMAQDPELIPMIMNVLWAARAMERMGDRCENIAEYVIYLVHGKDVRHVTLEEYAPGLVGET
jgi:phosphate transport system protein